MNFREQKVYNIKDGAIYILIKHCISSLTKYYGALCNLKIIPIKTFNFHMMNLGALSPNSNNVDNVDNP